MAARAAAATWADGLLVFGFRTSRLPRFFALAMQVSCVAGWNGTKSNRLARSARTIRPEARLAGAHPRRPFASVRAGSASQGSAQEGRTPPSPWDFKPAAERGQEIAGPLRRFLTPRDERRNFRVENQTKITSFSQEISLRQTRDGKSKSKLSPFKYGNTPIKLQGLFWVLSGFQAVARTPDGKAPSTVTNQRAMAHIDSPHRRHRLTIPPRRTPI